MTSLEPGSPDPDPTDPAVPDPVDLVLGPATRLLWRTPDSVHLELGGRAVIVEGLPQQTIGRMVAREVVPGTPVPPLEPAGRRAMDSLSEAGFLWPRPGPEARAHFAPPSARLHGELTALAIRHGERAAELLDARRYYSVVVFGDGRAAAHLAALLAAAGVGRVRCIPGPGSARLRHATPGGLLPGDEGEDLTTAARNAILRAAPDADTTPLPTDERPDLTVIAVDAPIDEDRRVALHADGAAHLALALGTDHGVVGPLVVPGLTSCLRCADLHRRDRDPAWSALAAQLALPRRYGPTSDVTVASIVVGAAAMQALTFLDGGDPACIDGTLELRPPDWRLRRRGWPHHPDCDCSPGLDELGTGQSDFAPIES